MNQEGHESAARPPAEPQPGGLEPDNDARHWAMLCHLSALSTAVLIPGLIPPLVIWLIKKDEHPFIDDQGKESLNFQISIMVYLLISGAVTCVCCLSILLVAAIGLFDLVMVIVAGVQASNGVRYRYPACIRLID